ncbi:4589_t:CDS:2, partial [Acaulospora colombiana]
MGNLMVAADLHHFRASCYVQSAWRESDVDFVVEFEVRMVVGEVVVAAIVAAAFAEDDVALIANAVSVEFVE